MALKRNPTIGISLDLFVTALLSGTLIAGPARSALPTARNVLQSMLAAHAQLGPATITCTEILHNLWLHEKSNPTGYMLISRSVTRRNDGTHFVTRNRSLPYQEDSWSNGRTQAVYQLDSKRYVVSRRPIRTLSDGGWGNAAREIRWCRTVARDKHLEDFYTVSTIRWDGTAAYRLTSPRGEHGSSSVIVRTSDYLLIGSENPLSDGSLNRKTIQYLKHAQPFPVATFVFHPPPGARHVKTLPY